MRKPPVKHRVNSHVREGRPVRSFVRGNGADTQTQHKTTTPTYLEGNDRPTFSKIAISLADPNPDEYIPNWSRGGVIGIVKQHFPTAKLVEANDTNVDMDVTGYYFVFEIPPQRQLDKTIALRKAVHAKFKKADYGFYIPEFGRIAVTFDLESTQRGLAWENPDFLWGTPYQNIAVEEQMKAWDFRKKGIDPFGSGLKAYNWLKSKSLI